MTPPAQPPIRVLVVEDDVAMGEMMQLVLEHQGFEASIVSTGAAALSLIERERIDVAIVDIELPGMDGVELLAELQRRAPVIRRIVCSAHPADSDESTRARELAHDMVAKQQFVHVGDTVRDLVGSLPHRGT